MIQDNKNQKYKLQPIGRLKYFFYTFIDFVFVYCLISSSSNQEIFFISLINSVFILPILIVKRANDLDFPKTIALPIWFLTVLIHNLSIFYIIPKDFYYPIMIYLMIPNAIMQLCLLFVKGKYDSFTINWKNLYIELTFGNYVKNVGIQRLCFVFSCFLAIVFFFQFSRMGWNLYTIKYLEMHCFLYALIGFYIPFVLAATIQWIINGFNNKS